MTRTALRRNHVRRLASLALTITAVAVTLATSPDDGIGPDIVPSGFTGNEVAVWSDVLVLEKDDAGVETLMAIPGELFEGLDPELRFLIQVEVDGTESNLAPWTSWDLRIGGSSAPSSSFTMPEAGAGFATEESPWKHVGDHETAWLPLTGDSCDGAGCIPCSIMPVTCSVTLRVERTANALPPMRVTIEALMPSSFSSADELDGGSSTDG